MGTQPNIFLDEEKITKLIKEEFEKEFKKQEVNITKIISSYFTLTIREIKSLKQEVNNLKENIEFTQNDLETKVSDMEKKMFTFEINCANNSLPELQDRPRGNNIRVDEVTEEKGEMWEDCEKKVLEKLRDKLEIEDVTIERAHRVKPYQNKIKNKCKVSPRTIVCKLPNDKDIKTRILQKCNCLKVLHTTSMKTLAKRHWLFTKIYGRK